MALTDLPLDHDINHLKGALRLIEKRGVAVDGGAHKGIWTRILESNFGHVIAIEPFHKVDCTCEVVKAALGEHKSRGSMKPGKDNTGQYHLAMGDDVDIITIDSLNIDPDFIKLDIEGMELPALRGAIDTIARCKPAIMVEMNGLSERYNYSDSDLIGFLEDLGYEQEGRWNKDYLFVWSGKEQNSLKDM